MVNLWSLEVHLISSSHEEMSPSSRFSFFHLKNAALWSRGGEHFLGVLKGIFKLRERPFSGPQRAYKDSASQWYVEDEFSRQKLHSHSERIDFRSELAACQSPRWWVSGVLSVVGFPNPLGAFLSPTPPCFEVNIVGSGHAAF